jgi:ankyrin repeat protein
MRDKDQKMPLAYAFENKTTDAPDIFRILSDAAPETAREQDNRGQFLLHQCLDYSSEDTPGREEMASIMLEAFPDAVNIADNDGWLPIHLAALTCRAKVLKMITEGNPANLSSTHPTSGTVAHMAARGCNVSRSANLRNIPLIIHLNSPPQRHLNNLLVSQRY